MEQAFADPRFVIQRRLGAGGMGVVYQALDRERNQVVALKTLRDAEGASIVRFKHEFRALADVTHPNLVSLYELIAHPGRLFFTMELVVGKSFLRWVRSASGAEELEGSTVPEPTPLTSSSAAHATAPGRRGATSASSKTEDTPGRTVLGPLDAGRLRSALRELAEGVAALHSAGMLHRDLKPSNVLVTPLGAVKILDFGLATELLGEQTTGNGDAGAGTAAYMSPEQGAGLTLGPASDWYSVGVMLYEALTGRLPFLGSRTEILMDRQVYEPPPANQIQADVPEDLNALCVALLRRDPQARPDAREVLRRLGSANAGTIAPSSRSAQMAGQLLVGREAHLRTLEEAWAAARGGAAVIQLVHGSSGMGKSALVRRFLDDAAAEGAIALAGRCYERESVPFKALDSVVDALSQRLARLPRLEAEGLMPRDILALARLFPVLRQVEAVTAGPRRAVEAPDPNELRRRAFGAVRELLARLADRQPVVVAIDDLQWGDVDSAALLAAVLRPPDAPSLLLLACCRTEDWNDSPFLHELRAQLAAQGNDVRELAVGPLDAEQSYRLALGLLDGDHSDGRAQAKRIAQEAAGSPFFIDELARHVSGGESSEPGLVSLDEVLRARVIRLAPDAARLLRVVAVAGRPLPLQTATRAAEVYDASAMAVLKAGNLIRTRGTADSAVVECYHDRIRETAVSLLRPDQLSHAHLRLAVALESTPQPDAEALAIHFRDAGDAERAAEYAVRAAERATETLAFDRAAQLYRLALSLRPARTLRVKLGEALVLAGRGPEAAEAFLSATAQAPAAEALDLQRRAATQLLRAGRIPEGIAAFRQVLEAVGMKLASTPGRAVASLLLQRARIRLRGLRFKERDETQVPADHLTRIDVAYAVTTGLGMVDSIRATEFEARQLLLALDAGEPHRILRALAAETCMLSMQGTRATQRTERAYDAMKTLGDRLDTHEAQALIIGVRGIIGFQEGRWKEGFEFCDSATELLRDHCRGLHWELTTCHAFALFSLARMGHYRALSQRLTTLVKEANERGDLYAVTNMLCSVGYCRPLLVGDPEGSRRELEETVARWNVHDSFHLQHFNAVLSNTYIDLYGGEGARAWERISGSWRSFERSVLLRLQTLRVNAIFARARAAMSAALTNPALQAQALADARRLEREGASYCQGSAQQIRGTIAHQRGDTERAVALLADAETRYDAHDMSMSAAATRWQRGRILGGSEGAALIGRAEAFFREEGAAQPLSLIALTAPGFR
jgi:serine/threonine protein kinase/tetratricopeptide (TPR) repeat protein